MTLHTFGMLSLGVLIGWVTKIPFLLHYYQSIKEIEQRALNTLELFSQHARLDNDKTGSEDKRQ